jgi:hypothetical protein
MIEMWKIIRSKKPKISAKVPAIDQDELKRFIEEALPNAQIKETFRNPQYESWQLEITTTDLCFEFSWGPLSGFGFTDLKAIVDENYNPFDPYDVGFESLADAQQFLVDFLSDKQP